MVKNSISGELLRRGIDVKELWVRPHGSLEDVFDPASRYTSIQRFPPGTVEPDPDIPGLVSRHTFGSIKVAGIRKSYCRERDFMVYLSYRRGAIIPFDKNVLENPHLLLDPNYCKQNKERYSEGLRSIDEKLQILEAYFHQRMEAQQPNYNYTYRSRTEIK